MTSINDLSPLQANDFKIIQIDVLKVADALQRFIHVGSSRTGIAITDIQTRCTGPVPTTPHSLKALLQAGIPLFDAVAYLTVDRAHRPPLVSDADIVENTAPSLEKISEAIFYVYFLLVTQARYPTVGSGSDQIRVPRFLKDVMRLSEEPNVYLKRICSFNPVKFNPAWLKCIHIPGLGVETMNRFGLGVAGYRLFGPFKCYEVKESASRNIKSAYAVARHFAINPPNWQIHPITRNPTILSTYGNLNKNLANLILECFTENQIDEMVATKMIYQRPVHDPQCANYKTWSIMPSLPTGDEIFQNSMQQ